MKYSYDPVRDEFVIGAEVTGNRVYVTREDAEGTLRFRVEVDDLPHVLGALNRLVQKLIPTFRFPVTADNPGVV